MPVSQVYDPPQISPSQTRDRGAFWPRGALVSLGFAGLLLLGTHLAIPMPSTPVPVTLQTFFVLAAGICLGPFRGLLSVFFYLALRGLGTTVDLQSLGIPPISWSTSGYLLGFALAVPVAAAAAERRHPLPFFLGLLLAHASIVLPGVVGLALWHPEMNGQERLARISRGIDLGLLPFLPGLLFKTLLAFALGLLLRWRKSPSLPVLQPGPKES